MSCNRNDLCWCTVYPKKYAHGFCFAVLCCGYTLTDFPISIRLTSLALWQSNDCPSASKATLMNMDKYFMWIHYERLHNHNKAKHNKTVCIFLGIYCTNVVSELQPATESNIPGRILDRTDCCLWSNTSQTKFQNKQTEMAQTIFADNGRTLLLVWLKWWAVFEKIVFIVNSQWCLWYHLCESFSHAKVNWKSHFSGRT